jgi:enoyl-CoA hydratase
MARELVYSGRMLGPAEAPRIGLVNAVHPRAELMDHVKKVALEIANTSPNAVALSKRVMNEGIHRELHEAIELEARAFGHCFESPEQREGMTAFLEKRTPTFASGS